MPCSAKVNLVEQSQTNTYVLGFLLVLIFCFYYKKWPTEGNKQTGDIGGV